MANKENDKRGQDKLVKGRFTDNREKEFHVRLYDFIVDNASDLQLTYNQIVGVMEIVKHIIEHEITVLDGGMIEW